jgi:hypothetical protein
LHCLAFVLTFQFWQKLADNQFVFAVSAGFHWHLCLAGTAHSSLGCGPIFQLVMDEPSRLQLLLLLYHQQITVSTLPPASALLVMAVKGFDPKKSD